MEPPVVGVAYVNFNSAEIISDSIETLSAPHQLIVVDNFHSDEARAKLHDLMHSNTTIVERPNDGFAAGVNAANASLDPSLSLVLLNPDAKFAPQAMEQLISRAISSGADIVSPRILNAETNLIWFDGGYVRKLTGEVVHRHFNETADAAVEYKETEFVSGCALFLSPKARRELLPLREDLFMYYEDVELSTSAAKRGIQLWVDPHSIVYHDEGVTSRKVEQTRSPLFYYFQGRNRLIAQIGTSRGLRLAFTPLAIARTTLRILRRERPRSALITAYLRGTLHGVLKSGQSI